MWFDYETPGQDGCDARVLTAARAGVPGTDDPELGARMSPPEPPSPAFQDRLTIRFANNHGDASSAD